MIFKDEPGFKTFSYIINRQSLIYKSHLVLYQLVKKTLLIWVGDNPSNNNKIVRKMREKGAEVIQLTSTMMANKWTKGISLATQLDGCQI